MTIKTIKVYKKNLALTRPYTIAFNTTSDVEAVFVEIELTNGMIGLGSANPSKEVVGEDVDDAFLSLQTDAIQQFVGRDISEIFSIIDEVDTQFPHKPGTLAAMDMALHDAFCQYLGISVARFYNQKIEKMATSVTIGIKGFSETLEEAAEYVGNKFKILKVKLGLNFEEDVERLVKLREKYNKKIAIRVDANQGYTLKKCYHFLNEFKN